MSTWTVNESMNEGTYTLVNMSIDGLEGLAAIWHFTLQNWLYVIGAVLVAGVCIYCIERWFG